MTRRLAHRLQTGFSKLSRLFGGNAALHFGHCEISFMAKTSTTILCAKES